MTQQYSHAQMVAAKNQLSGGEGTAKAGWNAAMTANGEFESGWGTIKKGLVTLRGGAEDNAVNTVLGIMGSTDTRVQRMQADIKEISAAVEKVLNVQVPSVIHWLDRHIQGVQEMETDVKVVG